MTTKRKPYVRPMTSTWWKKLPFYRFYMLREGTAVPAVWFSIELISSWHFLARFHNFHRAE